MSTATPTATILRTEARLFTRELGSLFWIVLFPTVLLCVLALIPSFREPADDLGGQRVIDLYTSVSVLLAGIMAAVMAMPAVLTGYRERGILRRLRTTPASPAAVLGAQVGVHAAAVAASAVLVLAVAWLVFDVPLPGQPAWYVLVLVLATAASFAIGALVTAVSPTTRVGQTVGTIAFFPMMFTAGVYLPVPTMGGALHTVVTATPLGAAAEMLNDALTGSSPDLVDLLVTGGWTVVLALVAVRLFRWE